MSRVEINANGRIVVAVETETVAGRTCYVVTGSTGYRAVLPACGHEDGRAACPLRWGHAKTTTGAALGCDGHNGRACHGWHQVNTERFAREVLNTYGSTRKHNRGGVVGVKRGAVAAKYYAALTRAYSKQAETQK